LAFYPDVFGWATTTVSDTPEFRYSIGAVAGEEVVGLTDAAGTLAAGHPGSWFVYLGVADADLAVATVVDLGGTVTGPAQDSPHGRFAAVTDPMGAAFTVIAGP
jgi:predicted enzyme related to lactoylglutathione lyase